MSIIQVRVDDKLKNQAKKVLDKVGLNMSSAVKLYLKQITRRQGLPFLILTENGLTPEEEDQVFNIAQEARHGKQVTKAMDEQDAIDYLTTI